MNTLPDNRAVSTLFRAFGGAGERAVADLEVLTSQSAMHRGEVRAFAVWIPLTILVALGDFLIGWLGLIPGLLLAAPLSFLCLNILPFILAGKNPRIQWQLWFSACVLWAVFHSGRPGFVGLFSYLWIAIAVMTLAGGCLLAWQRMMRVSGNPGNALRFTMIVLVHAIAVVVGFKYGWLLGLTCGAGIAASICWAVLSPYCQWLGPVYLTTDDSRILITIDDGPDPHDTPLLLDLLDRHHAKAIFFMIGEKVRAHPELAREVVRRGHEIGNHTMTHPQASFWCAGPWRTRREIADCQKTIAEITGVKPRWFRAPVGHRNLFTHPVASPLGLRVMAWNRRGFDAVEKDAGKVLGRILPELSAGDIVLLHEATPIAEKVLAGVLEKASSLVVQPFRVSSMRNEDTLKG
ncbi:MAG: polysaccharide deacetylase family protein [Luteolibacter sp.]